LIYEGHDVPRTIGAPAAKDVDQQSHLPNGRLTQNGFFFNAAIRFKKGEAEPELVKVYEKIRDGIWAFNGFLG
jgi:hypothetical protein